MSPSGDARVCRTCRTWLPILRDSDTNEEPTRCENCAEVRDVLNTDPLPFSIISLYKKPSKLRDWLTRYKGREGDEDAFDPDSFSLVRSILGRFIIEHGAHLQQVAGELDGIIVVPSTHRPAPHPLEEVIESLRVDLPLIRLLKRGPGELGFRSPHVRGYCIAEELAPLRLLLLDDVYTTGARLNSASIALTAAGHQVRAGLVLARRINPDYVNEAATLWRMATSNKFDWRTSPWIPR